MRKAVGEERVEERSEEIFIVGLRVEEGLLVTELLVPEIQTKVFLAEVAEIVLVLNQEKF